MPQFIFVVEWFILITAAVAVPLVLLQYQLISDYTAISLTLLMVSFVFLLNAYTFMLIDFINIDKRPIFVSPYIFPVYRFNPETKNLNERNEPMQFFIFGIIIWIFQGILTVVYVQP